jgi:hypothetical protein
MIRERADHRASRRRKVGHVLGLSAGLGASGRSRNAKAIENRIPSADKTDGSRQPSIP